VEDETGTAVAFAVAGPCLLPVDEMPDGSGELTRLYVLQAHQGAGLGVMLLEQALAWLHANFREIYLSVYADNLGAQRLYSRYGFEIIKEYKDMVGNHADPEFIMHQVERKTGA
ncbi:MAG: GNAT family N-acetyltransferase, partial [Pseudomonadota bacterium]